MQDDAPVHTAKFTQHWCRDNLKGFGEKADLPGNSLDLNPFEDLWAIFKERFNEKGQMTNRGLLIENLKLAWQNLTADTLENLVASKLN